MNAAQLRFLLLTTIAAPLLLALASYEHVPFRQMRTELATRYRSLK